MCKSLLLVDLTVKMESSYKIRGSRTFEHGQSIHLAVLLNNSPILEQFFIDTFIWTIRLLNHSTDYDKNRRVFAQL